MPGKIDRNAPHLVGKYFELDENECEFAFPPVNEQILPWEDIDESNAHRACPTVGCNGNVKITEGGNSQYAWYFLTNISNQYIGVTIERRWIYQGKWRRETARHRLYAGQYKEVFSFPRNQSPICCIVACNIE